MFRKFFAPAVLALVAMTAGLVVAKSEVTLEGVKCLFADKDVNPEKSAEWKKGKVYFCCGNCQGKFGKMTKEEKDKVAAKANAQLVASKQYVQAACPMSGGELNAETKIKVGAAEIAFCCNNCKGKAEKMEGDEQLEALFGEKAFDTAKFKPAEKDDK